MLSNGDKIVVGVDVLVKDIIAGRVIFPVGIGIGVSFELMQATSKKR